MGEYAIIEFDAGGKPVSDAVTVADLNAHA